MNLIIDSGNSRIKVALFDKSKMVSTRFFNHSELNEFDIFIQNVTIDGCIIGSVSSVNNSFLNKIHTNYPVLELNSTTPLPIKNRYTTPHSLGNDRLANAVAGFTLFPNQNVLIIDAGTCLKFDFVNETKEYIGGSISPGLLMRYQALHQFTDKLPLLQVASHPPIIGRDTPESIHSGVVNGMIGEINSLVNQYEKNYSDLKTTLCGGDTAYFSDHLKFNIFADLHLTLKGLNEILLYNQ